MLDVPSMISMHVVSVCVLPLSMEAVIPLIYSWDGPSSWYCLQLLMLSGIPLMPSWADPSSSWADLSSWNFDFDIFVNALSMSMVSMR